MQKPESRIDALAAAQYGAFSRAQALEAGVSSPSIGRRLDSGEWVRIFFGIYRLASAPRSWHQLLVAAWLWAGEGAVVSHRAAATLLGLADMSCTFAELWVPRVTRPPSRAVRLHKTSDLPQADVRRFGPVRVTNATRTLIDLGAVLDPLTLEAILEDALNRGLVSLRRLRSRLDELAGPGRRGPGVLARILASRAPGGPAESRLEVKAFQALRAAGLPIPERQYRLRCGDANLRIDLAYPQNRIAIECDGVKFHATRRGWERDRTKNNLLNLAGWTIVRATWSEIDDGTFVESVAQALFLCNGYRSPITIAKRSAGYDRLNAKTEETRWKA